MAGCVKLQLLASRSHVHDNGNRMPVTVFTSVYQRTSLWLCLHLRLYIMKKKTNKKQTKKTLMYISMVISDSKQMIDFDSDKSFFLHNASTGHTFLCVSWHSSCSWTAGCVKLQTPINEEKCGTSQWTDVGHDAWFDRDFKHILSHNFIQSCLVMLQSRLITIGNWERVMSTIPEWVVVQWRHPSSYILGMSLHWTTNHSGVIDITYAQPWSIPWIKFV